MPEFTLGAFIYPYYAADPFWAVKPIMSVVAAPTLHQARRILVNDLLNHGFYVKDTRHLTGQLSPFDRELWEIS